MEQKLIDASNWEKDTYWNHFYPIRFSLILNHGFDELLAIPTKFSENMTKKLQNTVTLKGPSGVTWDIGLMINDAGQFFFKHGWQEFVKDHSLRENDHLVFSYNRDSQFDVLVFDGQSLCEKEAAYFVRKGAKKREHTMVDDDSCSTKRKISGISGIEIQALIENSGNSSSNNSEDDESISLRKPLSVQPVTDIKRNKSPGIEYVSNRRPVTEDEKKKARKLAEAAASEKSFLVTMASTHISKKFCLGVPQKWIRKHLTKNYQNIVLRVGEKTWHTGFRCRKDCNWGGITSGWKTFAIDNNLEEFDVCVFEPCAGLLGATLLDVKVFRVVEEVTPLRKISSVTPKSRIKESIKATTSKKLDLVSPLF